MLNHITIMGRLTRDPELRATTSGTKVAAFTLAVDRDGSGEKKTDFIDCVAWRHTAEFLCSYFGKGRMAVVSGRLQIRNWTANDGTNRRSAEVIAESVYFGDSKREAAAPNYPEVPNYSEAPDGYSGLREIDDDGDLPF